MSSLLFVFVASLVGWLFANRLAAAWLVCGFEKNEQQLWLVQPHDHLAQYRIQRHEKHQGHWFQHGASRKPEWD
jgi:hypothetical protein